MVSKKWPNGGGRGHLISLVVLVVFGVVTRLPGLYSRSIWHDETVTLLETGGDAQPVWPQQIETVDEMKRFFSGRPSFTKIARGLSKTDIHPPVYYWLLSLWRRALGYSLETARLFSLVCSVGGVLLLYTLLVLGEHPAPLLPALLFAAASGSVYMGQDARAYALATLFMLAASLFAYLAATSPLSRRQAAFGFLFALCGGLAFQTNYLTLFPIGAVALWFVIVIWKRARWQAVLFPLLIAAISLAWFETLRHQLGARPHQNVGFPGLMAEWDKMITQNGFVFWSTFHPQQAWLFTALLATLVFGVAWRWQLVNKKLFFLFLGMMLAPSLGVLLLDAAFDKNLPQTRYWLFALPGLSVVLSYGLVQHVAARWLLLVVLLFQLGAQNWGAEYTPGWPGSVSRSWAALIEQEADETTLVLLGAGHGRGFPSLFLYELNGDLHTLILDDPADVQAVGRALVRYDTVWLLSPREATTRSFEDEAARLLTTNQFAPDDPLETFFGGTAVRFERMVQ